MYNVAFKTTQGLGGGLKIGVLVGPSPTLHELEPKTIGLGTGRNVVHKIILGIRDPKSRSLRISFGAVQGRRAGRNDNALIARVDRNVAIELIVRFNALYCTSREYFLCSSSSTNTSLGSVLTSSST